MREKGRKDRGRKKVKDRGRMRDRDRGRKRQNERKGEQKERERKLNLKPFFLLSYSIFSALAEDF